MGESTSPEPKSEAPATPRELHEPVTLPPPPDLGKLEPDADSLRSARPRPGWGPSEVSKTIRELSQGLSAATQANEQLMSELRTLRARLGSSGERERAPTNHAHGLDGELELVAAQQDEFLAALLEEHEEAQARAAKIERERDELRAEASRLRARLGTHRISTNPPPPPTVGRPAFRPRLALELDPDELDATLRGPKPCGPAPPPSFGPSPSGFPPPAAAVGTDRPPRPVSAASLPPDSVGAMPILKRKPDPATRPLVDYSLGEGGVRSETLEGARISTKSSKPPK
jgi:uncharacterized coiled-coil protein SlyX